ncbi:glycoside hydrolase family 38 C-terminal domain-containing protein [Oricola sp.]|uniref:alpha-mannosidase n=1 Tax=Oricola sp. TaxID=1979950 RepID=UPI0025ED64BA|nr:glycoside hydrolase family 38 C-terminal domain-containing protein [Oricola sp.]MCI5077796.1 glycosyl hydrolase-related protein [Oricola sp.]
MPLTISQRLDRLQERTSELVWWRERESLTVDGWTVDGAPIELGGAWPTAQGVLEFAAHASVPTHWPLDATRLILDLGGESLVTLSQPGLDAVSFGHDPNHREYSLRGRSLDIRAESVARKPFGQPVREPRLIAARLAWIDLPVHRLHLLLTQIGEAVSALGDHEVVPHMLNAAETALRNLDWPSDTANYIARVSRSEQQQTIWQLPELKSDPDGLNEDERRGVVAAYDSLVSALALLKQRFPPQGQVVLTGHAHIDLAWLWPWEETRRKIQRTFRTALSLIDASPDFVFNQSTAAYYAQLEEDDPALLEMIRKKAAAGRWETIGGMWVEPDTNMPTGESLVRQVLYGQRYFEKQFGVRHKVCWLPDCFGFSGALPQILRQGGLEHFFTIKVNWSETNAFPHDLFWWEGLDGSRVLTHTFDNPMAGYNGFVRPDCLLPTWKNFRGKTQHDETLLAVGYGDGGGGVTPEMVERETQLRQFPALPQAQWGRVGRFFDRARAGEPDRGYPVWSGEIYLELHRATLTTQSAVKKLHRHAERALITAETLASMAMLLGGPQPVNLEPAWRLVLKNEFHDILPGSGIAETARDAERELGNVQKLARAAHRAAMAVIEQHLPKGGIENALIVANPSATDRPLSFALPDGQRVAADETVPALGVKVLDFDRLTPTPGLVVTANRLENAHLKVVFGADGTISSLIHKETGREALDGRGNQLWVYPADKPRYWDAWDIEDDYALRGAEITDIRGMGISEASAQRGAIRVVKAWRNSTITQTYALSANGRRLDIETEIDWHDRRALVRTVNPIAVSAREATFECALGVVKRPTHVNTSWDAAQFEVPGHRFCDLSEPGFGVALLNDAKYGHSAKKNVLGLSLVRGPVWPDPQADEGTQTFTYSLYPHPGDWHEGGVREQAEWLNQPPVAVFASGLAPFSASLVSFKGIPAALSALKPAENGDGLVLRVYEPAGRRGAFDFTLPDGWTGGRAINILEERMPRERPHALMPFELRSWRLTRR